MGNTTLRNPRKIFTGSGGDSSLPDRVLNLENNEYKITYYEIISGASGSITLPTGATINAGEFGLSGNCVLSKIDGSNKPTFESPITSGGTIVTASLNETTGAWIASGTYTDTNVALIYSIKIKAVNYGNLDYDFIIETTDNKGGWVDYSATSTIVGWSSFTIKSIYYIDMGAYYLYKYYLVGTSDATNATFTIHVNEMYIRSEDAIRTANNGINATGLARTTIGSNTVDCFSTIAGAGYTASGTKTVNGTFIIMK